MAAICTRAAPIPAALEGEHGGRRRDDLGGVEEQRSQWLGHGARRREDG
jgi:hypothetical protein